jgi:hypothetical protein
MTNTTSSEQHPDLMELRARYDRAAETPAARALEGFTFLAGSGPGHHDRQQRHHRWNHRAARLGHGSHRHPSRATRHELTQTDTTTPGCGGMTPSHPWCGKKMPS